VGSFLLDTVEVYLPFLTFIVLFLVFVSSIFFRYVLNAPFKWSMEVQLMAFIWTVMFGAAYTWRKGAHVKFMIVYDMLNEKWKRIFRLLSNGLVFIACVTLPWPAWEYLQKYMHDETTAAFSLRFDLVFFPVVPFFILIAGHAAYDLWLDFRRPAEEKQLKED
jgi:TRAP-type C4-dicarboxylate transport system permease small subunit